jgi:drug/metabolite transporter (DMT)-like permease
VAPSRFALSPSLSLVLAAAFWGAGTVISKELLATVPPILFLVIQLAPSAAALWIVVWASGAKLDFGRWLLPILLLGLLNPGIAYTLSMLGLARTAASVTTLLWAAEPALIVALAWLFLREPVSARLIALTASAAAGVALASGLAQSGGLAGGTALGAALILAGVLCCAFYTVLSRKIAIDVDPLLMVAVQQTAALAWVLAIWPLEQQGGAIAQLAGLTARDWLGGLVSGLMYYAFAYWLYLNGLRAMPASKAGSFFNLIPIFGIAIAYVFLGERLSFVQWIGAAIILASVYAIQKWPAAPQRSLL